MNPMKYYVDDAGVYLGGWDENPPDGAVEVPFAPAEATQIWTGTEWNTPTKLNIVNAPKTLFGGPTLGDIYNGH